MNLPFVLGQSFDNYLAYTLLDLATAAASKDDEIAMYAIGYAISQIRAARKLLSRDVGRLDALPPKNPVHAAIRAVLDALDAQTHFEKSAHLRYAESVLLQAFN